MTMSGPTVAAAAPEKVTLPVEGMTCAACQANVQRALSTAPGVTRAAVNLMMHEATVHFDPGSTDPPRLVDAINDTGYVSRLPSPAPAISDDEARERAQACDYAALRLKAMVSLAAWGRRHVASMPLMGGGITLESARGTRCPLPAIR